MDNSIKQDKGFNDENIFKVANSRLGWYKMCSMNVINYILSPTLLETKIKDGKRNGRWKVLIEIK